MMSTRRGFLVQWLRTYRNLSSSPAEKTERVRNYLDAWVGTSSSSSTPDSTITTNALQDSASKITKTTDSNSPSQFPCQSHDPKPLLLTGSSYLLPTLRLERQDTAASLRTRICAALENSIPGTASAKSMLQGKPINSSSSSLVLRWQVPIVLDLAALVPDGSPHYVAPKLGFLKDVVETLLEFGIRVVGVTDKIPATLEREAVEQLGLPSLMAKGRVVDRQSVAKVAMEDVVQLVVKKSQPVTTQEEWQCEDSIVDIMENGDKVQSSVESGVPEAVTNAELAPSLEKAGNDDAVPLTEDPWSAKKALGSTKVYHGSVRSGQQVSSDKNGSLIIIGSINSGGEALSDGDIIVFGKLRGRALAGLSDTQPKQSAKICATSFDPELVCIGDTFTTVDDVRDVGLERRGDAAMVSLDKDCELIFEHISL